MEAFLFQWDKACDAMPMLKPMSRLLGCGGLLLIALVILPSMLMPENQGRPHPLQIGVYKAGTASYVETKEAPPPGSLHNVEPERLRAQVINREQDIEYIGDNIVRAPLTGGIGVSGSANTLEAAQASWDYKTEVAYIIPTGFEEYTFQIDTGFFVDTRDLHKTGQYRQLVTVKAPTKAFNDLKNFPVNITKMRDIKTQCIYYSMEIFGKRRLVLGGSNGKIEVGC